MLWYSRNQVLPIKLYPSRAPPLPPNYCACAISLAGLACQTLFNTTCQKDNGVPYSSSRSVWCKREGLSRRVGGGLRAPDVERGPSEAGDCLKVGRCRARVQTGVCRTDLIGWHHSCREQTSYIALTRRAGGRKPEISIGAWSVVHVCIHCLLREKTFLRVIYTFEEWPLTLKVLCILKLSVSSFILAFHRNTCSCSPYNTT